MFRVEDRERLRAELVAAERADSRVTAVALTGSAALDCEDRWSDIDLAFRLEPGADEPGVIADWTARMCGEHGAIDHLDVRASTRFRVFLLASTLQVNLAFWRWDLFAATGPAFRLISGAANEKPLLGPPAATEPRRGTVR